ncbi:MAG: GNAT family N-acetyltransferase [Erysipelotrichia bacterium]|nr:GNAT family N-acetyltransferase [Erysipelotrichia bacterium]
MIEYICLEDLLDEDILQGIYDDEEYDYYWSDDFSPELYITLAQAGFITVGLEHQGQEVLLPQIQTHYALLEHINLHMSHHVQKLLHHHPFTFSINTRFTEVIEGIKESYEDCWIHASYEALLHQLYNGTFEGFKLISAEISDSLTGTLVGGEIGYICNNIYTGLTKFSLKEKAYTNWGTLQRVVLTHYLDSKGIHFSNLGHPKMQYKIDLGAVIYPRKTLLKKCGLL